MFNKRTVRATALALALAVPFFLSAKEKKKNFNLSAFGAYQSLPANTQAKDKTTNQVAALFPGWITVADKLSGHFTDIYGAPIPADGHTLEEKANSIISQKLGDLGVNASQWKKIKAYDAPKASYVNYKQVINNHDVVFATMNFRFTKAGDLARIQMKNYGQPNAGTTPTISKEAAKKAAVSDINEITVTSAIIDGNWSWFPIPQAGGYVLHPAWHFTVKATAKGSVPLVLTGYVDATNGTLLYRTNDVKETAFDVTVKGMVYKNGTLNPATLEPLANLSVYDYSSFLTTDTAGHCSNLFSILPLNAEISLQGAWSTVIDDPTGNTPFAIDYVTLGGSTFTYPAYAPASDRHVNAYYHVNRVHDFMKGYFPSFYDMDFSLPTNVDISSGTCNAYYNGTSINFFAADATCNSFAEIGDIIYHEYGHAISDHFYMNYSGGSSLYNGALNEACSDIWALSITRNPVLGENSFTGYGGFIRRYDRMPHVYPIDWTPGMYADPHYNGEIIAGCWWDVGVNIGSVATMTKLFTDVYYDVPDGPDGTEGTIYQSILVDALMADDNDGDLTNGTPHYSQILAAFVKHGIYLEGESSIMHNEIDSAASNTAIPVSLSLLIDNPVYVHDVTVSYRANGTGSWLSLPLTASGITYTGNIPAQPMGTTVEYFFTIHDALGKPNAYFPIACNPALAAEQANIPYQFGVGMVTRTNVNFQTTPTGWSIGNNPGDDATDGIWKVAIPVASPYAMPPYNINCFPPHDHTTGTTTGKCLVAGWGAGPSGGSVVSDGTTTVLTPSFDISTFNNPVIEYYRWFSNEEQDNVKNDPWIVQIRNTAGTTWQTVERTYQGELNWRRRIFPVSAFLPASTTSIQLKFSASDSVLATWNDNGQSVTTANVDDFFILDKGVSAGVENITPLRAEINPNPADNVLNVTLQENNNTGSINLYDMSGKSLTTIRIEQGNNKYAINTQDIAAGLYNVVIQTGKSIQCSKVVVAH